MVMLNMPFMQDAKEAKASAQAFSKHSMYTKVILVNSLFNLPYLAVIELWRYQYSFL